MADSIEQSFYDCKISAIHIRKIRDLFLRERPVKDKIEFSASIKIERKEYNFSIDDGEFLDLIERNSDHYSCRWNYREANSERNCDLYVRYIKIDSWSSITVVKVRGKNRDHMHEVLADCENHLAASKDTTLLPNQSTLVSQEIVQPRVFIGHGRDPAWKDLKSHLSDLHGLNVVAYETGARAGHTIRDILDEMSSKSDIAFLVLTAEDALKDGGHQARANVIHETGLFQGRLGFSRAIMVVEEGAREFSNASGIQQLRFEKGRIKEVFGDVLATIRREFK